jgi:hypothetical protein
MTQAAEVGRGMAMHACGAIGERGGDRSSSRLAVLGLKGKSTFGPERPPAPTAWAHH